MQFSTSLWRTEQKENAGQKIQRANVAPIDDILEKPFSGFFGILRFVLEFHLGKVKLIPKAP